MKKFLFLFILAFGFQQLNALTVTVNFTNVSCNGGCNGTATAVPSGGTAPYTYSWAPSGATTASVSGLCAGVYTVTVTDAALANVSTTVTITQPTALTISFSSTAIACSGGTGSVTATVSGGTPGYTYIWTPGNYTGVTISNVPVGNYTCTITDSNACTVTGTYILTQPPAVGISISSTTNVSCHLACDGSATVLASGGTAPYTYAWSPAGGSTPTINYGCAGNYTCTVTDMNGCVAWTPVPITEPATLTASITPANFHVCQNDPLSLNSNAAGGTPPYSYSWSSGGGNPATTTTGNSQFTWNTSGTPTVSVTVTDSHGCTTTATTTVTVSPAPVVAITPNYPTICAGSTITLYGSGAMTYSWAPTLQTGSSITITPSVSQSYTLTGTDANGCMGTAFTTVTVNANPTIAITPNMSSICIAGTQTLSGSGGINYVWAPIGNTTASVSVSPTSMTTYTLTGTDVNGCTGTATATITIDGLSFSGISHLPATFCDSQSVTLSPSGFSGGFPPYTYSAAPNNSFGPNSVYATSGTYTMTVTDANGCVATNTTTLSPSPNTISLAISSVEAGCNFSNGSSSVVASGGTAPYTYLWSNGNTTANLTNVLSATYSVTVTDNAGCPKTRNVFINDSCDFVWPGDANDDAVADNNDILDIGIANGATGTARANATLNWIGQPSNPWGQTLLSGTDYKWVDCNGDGVINPTDTNAVIQNFGLTHNNRMGGIPVYDATLPDLTITMGQNTLASMTAGTLTVALGNSTTPVSNLYGLAFTLNFDPAQIDASSFRMNESGTWMGTPNTNLMGVVLHNGNGTGSVQIALTRLNHQNVNGFGNIANVGFMTTNNLVGTGNTQNVNFTISNVTVISASQTPQTVNTVNDSVLVEDPGVLGISVNGISQNITAYPNPFDESVQIILPESAKGKACVVTLTDASGRVVLSQQTGSANSMIIQRGQLEAGIYFCTVRSEGQMIGNTKLIVK